MEENKLIEELIKIKPSKEQARVEENPYYCFIHFGINTFTNSEWGKGNEDIKLFNPLMLNTDKWAKIIKKAGFSGVIFTAKHHDGFCLWQTKTTDFSIKNTPYKDGHGDIVKELSESCAKFDLNFGIYLSPWDMNSPLYNTTDYDSFYLSQLRELLTNYGKINMLWLDGANSNPNVKYNLQKYIELAKELQPEILVSNMGPDIRWCGNEAGIARSSEYSVVPKVDLLNDMPDFDRSLPDLGSREYLANFNDFMYYPSEMDVSIRPSWFYHEEDNKKVKKLNELMKIYYNSIGNNSFLLLNIPPNRDGVICPIDIKVLNKFAKEQKKFTILAISDLRITSLPQDNNYYYFLKFSQTKIDCLVLGEDTTFSQRVEEFKVYCEQKLIYEGTTIGFNKIIKFDKINTDTLKIVVTKSRFEPHFKKIKVLKAGTYNIK